jgi:hypothetical protein
MGCKLVRGETIYFVRHGGERSHELDPSWFSEVDALLPRVYAGPDNREKTTPFPSVIPIEIRTFEPV